MQNNKIYISMILTAFLWSGAFVAGKMSVVIIPPISLTFFRFLFAVPLIFIILCWKEPNNIIPEKKQIKPLVILGIIGTLGYHVFFFQSLRYTTAINSSLLGAVNPMLTALFAVVFFKERTSISRIMGTIISLFGVFGVITNLDVGIITSLNCNIGDLYMLVGVLCFSVYSLLSRVYMKKYNISPLKTTAYTFLVCALVSFPGMLAENPQDYLHLANGQVWGEILYMAVFASVVGYFLQLKAIQTIGAPKTAMFINLVPVFTIIQAVLILGEKFSLLKFCLMFLIMGGVYFASRPDKIIDCSFDKIAKKV
ncbi:MAG: DMT family transporter [Eubacteriales bacterium]